MLLFSPCHSEFYVKWGKMSMMHVLGWLAYIFLADTLSNINSPHIVSALCIVCLALHSDSFNQRIANTIKRGFAAMCDGWADCRNFSPWKSRADLHPSMKPELKFGLLLLLKGCWGQAAFNESLPGVFLATSEDKQAGQSFCWWNQQVACHILKKEGCAKNWPRH